MWYDGYGLTTVEKQEADPTAISYDEKLTQYLNAVLAADRSPAALCYELYRFTLFIGDECRDRGQTDWIEYWYRKAYDYLRRLRAWLKRER